MIYLVFFQLLMIWLLITVLGHGTWLLFAAVFRVLFGEPWNGPLPRSAGLSPKNDEEVTKQVVERLTAEGHLSKRQMAEIKTALLDSQVVRSGAVTQRSKHLLELDSTAQGSSPLQDTRSLQDSSQSPLDGDTQAPTEDLEAQVNKSVVEPNQPLVCKTEKGLGEVSALPIDAGVEEIDTEPVDVTLVTETESAAGINSVIEVSGIVVDPSEEDQGAVTQGAVTQGAVTQGAVTPGHDVMSRSDLIRSFLSSHNIRWGEIVAGILIVVCSIGLVRTLWGPLVSTHRLVPSLIFLVANSAIGGAGLYTLSRWRLRQTSRAVLVISTLLIPLSVLAGIAAVREEVSLLAIADPYTLAFVAVGSILYYRLAFSYISALTNRVYRRTVTFGFAIPVGLLPFGKAATERLADQAGWFLILASSAILLTSDFLMRSRGGRTVIMGRALSRIHLLFLTFATYACVLLTGYFAIRIENFGVESYLPLAMTLIPCLMGLGTVALGLREKAKVATHSLAGTILAICLLAPAFVIAVPASTSIAWIWVWSTLLSISLLWSTYRARQHIWAAIVGIPIGLASIFTIQNSDFVQIQNHNIWMRILSGESFLVVLAISFITALWLLLNRNGDREVWIKRSLLGWLSIAFLLAGALVILPTSCLGVLPQWGLSLALCLTLCFVLAAAQSVRFGDSNLVIASIITSLLFWLSLLKPSNWLSLAAIEPVALGLFLSGLTQLASEKANYILSSPRNSAEENFELSYGRLRLSFVDGCVAILVVFSLWLFAADQSVVGPIRLLLFASSLMLLASIQSLSHPRQLYSQAIIFLLVASCTFHWTPTRFFAVEYWQSGSAWWIVSLSLLAFSVIWLLIRECLAFIERSHGSKLQQYLLGSSFEQAQWPSGDRSGWDLSQLKPQGWSQSAESWALILAPLFGAIAVFSGLVQSILTLEIIIGHGDSVVFACVALVGYLIVGLILKRYVEDPAWRSYYVNATMVVFAASLSCWIADTLVPESQGRLYLTVATSLIVVLVSIAYRLSPNNGGGESIEISRRYLEAFLLAFPLLVSLRLFWADWIPQVSVGNTPNLMSMGVVIGWALLGSIWFRSGKSSFSTRWGFGISVLLFCAAAVLSLPFVQQAQLPHYIQVFGLAGLIWAITFSKQISNENELRKNHVLLTTLRFGTSIGVITAVLTTIRVFIALSYFDAWIGGFLVSLISAFVLYSRAGDHVLGDVALRNAKSIISWPVTISLLAGQIAWVLNNFVGSNESEERTCVALVWVGTSIAALLRERKYGALMDRFHVSGVSVILPLIAFALYPGEDFLWVLGIVSVAVAGGLVRMLSVAHPSSVTTRLSLCLGWWVLVSGSLLVNYFCMPAMRSWLLSGVFVVWSTAWLLVWCWRMKHSECDVSLASRIRAFPSMDLLTVFVMLSGYELFTVLFNNSKIIDGTELNFLYLTQWGALATLPLWTTFLPGKKSSWFLTLFQSSIVIAFVSIRISAYWHFNTLEQLGIAVCSIAVFNALFSHWCHAIVIKIARQRCSISEAVESAADTMLILITSLASGSMFLATLMIVEGQPSMIIHLGIGSIALSGWAVAQCTTIRDRESLRRFAMALALSAVGMWASVDINIETITLLKISMRWLVVSVLLLPAMIWILPTIFGTRGYTGWSPTFRWGVLVVSVFGAVALGSILLLESLVRTDSGLPQIPTSQVLFVGCVLVALALGAAVFAVGTGPNFALRDRFPLSDRNRGLVAYAAQILALSVCAHLYLCRPHWLYIQLLEKWYFVVMAIAFASVGMTEIVKRRGDAVLLKVFQRNAFLLPLIPIVGCWMSSYEWKEEIFFADNSIQFDVLLFVAAIYYGIVSFMWKHTISRVFSIGLGNFAWWVMLTRVPGWAFLEHPQLWVIPPAFCILFVVNYYRHRMEASTVAFIRYAAVLTIYISSTADMLIQQIGLSLMGPILLILLSLAGMLAGIILRVRAFLFLGAAFVFLGTVSMVWHANQSLGSWVWWVFGISTGVVLLIGLTLLEKYKVPLRRYADSLTDWNG